MKTRSSPAGLGGRNSGYRSRSKSIESRSWKSPPEHPQPFLVFLLPRTFSLVPSPSIANLNLTKEPADLWMKLAEPVLIEPASNLPAMPTYPIPFLLLSLLYFETSRGEGHLFYPTYCWASIEPANRISSEVEGALEFPILIWWARLRRDKLERALP